MLAKITVKIFAESTLSRLNDQIIWRRLKVFFSGKICDLYDYNAVDLLITTDRRSSTIIYGKDRPY